MPLAALAGFFCADFTPPRVTVDLDAPPEHRWDTTIAKFNSSLWAALAGLEAMSPVYKLGLELAPKLFAKQPDCIPDEHWAEMTGISRVSKVPIGMLVAINTLCAPLAGPVGPRTFSLPAPVSPHAHAIRSQHPVRVWEGGGGCDS